MNRISITTGLEVVGDRSCNIGCGLLDRADDAFTLALSIVGAGAG